MEQILKVGDVIEFKGKKYRAESVNRRYGCDGCAFSNVLPCPIQEDCNTNNVNLKEIKETPRRHLELGVVKVEGDNVTFKIIEQTHRNGEFSQRGSLGIFEASNGLGLSSRVFPEWKDDNHLLYCRGRACEKDDKELNCTVVDFAKISEAVTEYNATDGKGYEKPWPQKGDRYFYVASYGVVEGGEFCDGTLFDNGCKNYGNIFRTQEEAEVARDKVRALLKELAAK